MLFPGIFNFTVGILEKELISTFADALMGGKEAIIRNIARCREIYIRYSRSFMDRKFRLIHFDKIFLDYEISHMVPVTKLYPDDNCNPLRSIFKLIQLHDWSANQNPFENRVKVSYFFDSLRFTW